MFRMQANVFRGINRFGIEEVRRPAAGYGEAVIKVTLTTICRTDLRMEATCAIGDYRIITTLCPGGKERMRRLMEVVRHGLVDLTPFLTHTFPLAEIGAAYELFEQRRDEVIKVAIVP